MRKNWTIILCLMLLAGINNNSFADDANQITCTGKVVDNQGQPLAGVKVALHVLTYGQIPNPYDSKLIEEVTTRVNGEFSFSTTAKSDVFRYGYIVAVKEGLALGFANWRMDEGNKEIQIKLDQPKELAGIVVDEKDKPVSGAQVSISMLVIGRKEEN